MTIPEPQGLQIFDRRTVRAQRERAQAGLVEHDFLMREVAERLAERLDDMRRVFPSALELGWRGPVLAKAVAARAGIESWFAAAPTLGAARAAKRLAVVADEEAIPFAEGAFDLAISSFALHWVNDLPGTLLQARRCLKPDGLFLAALPGGESLIELRSCLLAAEAALAGGASPRVSPFVDLREAAGLLQRAGFALPVADLDTITVSYADPLALMRDLRGMGEANATAARDRRFLRRDVLMEAARLYRARHGDREGRVPATFQIVFLTGWAPHPEQPRALRPGSASARLAEALDAEEIPSGVKAGPGRAAGADLEAGQGTDRAAGSNYRHRS